MGKLTISLITFNSYVHYRRVSLGGIQLTKLRLGGSIHKGLVHVEANVRIKDAQQLRKLQVEPQAHPLSSYRLD